MRRDVLSGMAGLGIESDEHQNESAKDSRRIRSAVGAGDDGEGDVAAIAYDLDRRRLPDRELTDRHDEFVGVGDRVVTDVDDHVIFQDSAL